MQEREVVKLNGTAEQVELLYTTGKEGRNDKGVFYTWGLAGNRVMFATPALNAVIQAQHPRKGMKLSIQLAEGNRWDVRPIEPPAEQPRQIATASAAPQAAVEQHSNGSATIPTQVQYGIAFADFLILAGDAVRTAEKNSPTGSVRYDNRDVAAIATTMFIAADKAGFLTWNGAPQGGR